MPRARTRPTSQLTCVPVAFGLVVAAVLLVIVGVWVAHTPSVQPLVVLLLVAGGFVWNRFDSAKRARAAQQAEIEAAQSMEIGRYHSMDPRTFEDAIAYLCHRDGCRDARRTGGAGDLGADVTAIAPDGRRIVIQCKRYGPTTAVGSGDLQRFGGTCYSVHGAQVAAVVTTSRFTKPASGYAQSMGIRLFDQRALAAWATRTGPAPWML